MNRIHNLWIAIVLVLLSAMVWAFAWEAPADWEEVQTPRGSMLVQAGGCHGSWAKCSCLAFPDDGDVEMWCMGMMKGGVCWVSPKSVRCFESDEIPTWKTWRNYR